jgi:hypothetical protein
VMHGCKYSFRDGGGWVAAGLVGTHGPVGVGQDHR